MALPLDPTQPGNLTSPGLGDDEIRALKQFLVDVFGFPISPQAIGIAGFLFSTAGLTRITLQDLAQDPAAIGQFVRNATRLKVHNGAVQILAYLSDIQLIGDTTEAGNVNNSTEFTHQTDGIPANTIGTSGFIHGSATLFVNSILTGSSLTIRLKYGGLSFFLPILTNATGATQGGFGIQIPDFRIHSRGLVNSQGASAHAIIPPISPNLHLGTPGLFLQASTTPIAVDSSTSQSIQLTTQWSVANAGNSVVGFGLDVYKTK